MISRDSEMNRIRSYFAKAVRYDPKLYSSCFCDSQAVTSAAKKKKSVKWTPQQLLNQGLREVSDCWHFNLQDVSLKPLLWDCPDILSFWDEIITFARRASYGYPCNCHLQA